ncbi:Gamma-tubulin complex component protein [Melia azedarach]|uniref:Gamma-tubulin complex component protein n=2 Tax=Melia azedarach TaxID=155640 RepID=A0ACC1WUN2_MELAZ|nr:Gamma-tubulin complex component protein [Melia azedarach]KAJ4702599.1 Gamma-tubulin complex component protein [Melia azedarach]
MELKEIREILSENRVQDVSWLCSLSESELDMLISLKLLVLQRAKIIGHEELAKKFDLKTLRALGLILLEFIKGKVKDLSLFPVSAVPLAFLDGCNLVKSNCEDIMSIEELRTCLDISSTRRPPKRHREETSPDQKKQKRQKQSENGKRGVETGTRRL